MPDIVTSHDDLMRKQADHARTMLGGFTQRAVEILQELAELAENDRVRLSAVNSILDRAGVVAPQEVVVSASPEQHELVQREASEVIERIKANVEAQIAGKKGPKDLELLMLHEAEGDDETLAEASTEGMT